MNTVQLECFIAVAEHLNFSKASKILKITQPAVTHQIHTLEEELDVKLFHRTSRNVSLTTEGILFLADAQLILKTALSAKERLGRYDHYIPFELGCHNHLELKLLPQVLKKLAEEFPLLRPSIHLLPFPSIISMVENNQIHMTLGTKSINENAFLLFKELYTAPIACICSQKHPFARNQFLTKDQLKENFIGCSPRQIPDSIFAVHSEILTKLSPKKRFITEGIESALTLAKAQLGYTLYLDIPAAREDGLCYIPITDLPKISFGVYYRRDFDHPVLKSFLTEMSDFLNKNQERKNDNI